MVHNWFLSSSALPCCCSRALTWVSPPASPYLCLDLSLDLGLEGRDDASLLPCISTTIWGPANSWGWFHEAGLFSCDTPDLPHFVRFQVWGTLTPPRSAAQPGFSARSPSLCFPSGTASSLCLVDSHDHHVVFSFLGLGIGTKKYWPLLVFLFLVFIHIWMNKGREFYCCLFLLLSLFLLLLLFCLVIVTAGNREEIMSPNANML